MGTRVNVQQIKLTLIKFKAIRFLAYRILPLLQLPWYIRAFGVGEGLKFPLAFLTRKKNISLGLRNIKAPVIVRPGTSDVQVFFEIFVDKEYDVQVDSDVKLIVDAGANAGYTSLFFANKYPSAEILAIEPEESNFKMLIENTRAYPNVKPIRGAIWHRKAALKIKNLQDNDNWIFQVGESDEVGPRVNAILIGDLLRESGHDTIDILKLDIEGAEKELFVNKSDDWLSRVNVLIVELHDPLKPGCSESLDSATAQYPFRRFKKGRNLVLIKEAKEK